MWNWTRRLLLLLYRCASWVQSWFVKMSFNLLLALASPFVNIWLRQIFSRRRSNVSSVIFLPVAICRCDQFFNVLPMLKMFPHLLNSQTPPWRRWSCLYSNDNNDIGPVVVMGVVDALQWCSGEFIRELNVLRWVFGDRWAQCGDNNRLDLVWSSASSLAFVLQRMEHWGPDHLSIQYVLLGQNQILKDMTFFVCICIHDHNINFNCKTFLL